MLTVGCRLPSDPEGGRLKRAVETWDPQLADDLRWPAKCCPRADTKAERPGVSCLPYEVHTPFRFR